MTVQPTEESVRVFLAGHLAQAGNALTELSKVVSGGQPLAQAMITQIRRCDTVVSCIWTALIFGCGNDWEGAAATLDYLDNKLAQLGPR